MSNRPERLVSMALDRLHQLQMDNLTLTAQRDALLEALKEADDLLRIARDAMWKLGLNGLGSDCRLSHEVRMFALDFSAESRDGPGVLQVNGTGRLQQALASNRAAIKAVEGEKTHDTNKQAALCGAHRVTPGAEQRKLLGEGPRSSAVVGV